MSGLVGLGECGIDFIPLPSAGDGNLRYQACPGGSVANLCVAAAKLGVSAKFIGSVGDDHFGGFLRTTLASYGVDVGNMPVCRECGTFLAFVNLMENNERGYSFANVPGADKLLKYKDIDLESIASADVLHVSSNAPAGPVTRKTQHKILNYAALRNKVISYDINYREKNHKSEEEAIDVLWMSLPYATVVKATEEELALVTDRDTESGAKALIAPGSRTKIVLVTRGNRGADFFTKDASGHVDAPDVEVKDTTGAGDAFLGGFLSYMLNRGMLETLENLAPEAIRGGVEFANKTASLAVMKPGVLTSFPTLEEVTNARFGRGD
jgi:sugar/nucleoside kinase (ribokinase family)